MSDFLSRVFPDINTITPTQQSLNVDADSSEIDKQNAIANGVSLLYGEILPAGVKVLMDENHLHLDKASVFFEFGSGRGRLMIQAFLEKPNLNKIVGIEFSRQRYLMGVNNMKNLFKILNADITAAQKLLHPPQVISSHHSSSFDMKCKETETSVMIILTWKNLTKISNQSTVAKCNRNDDNSSDLSDTTMNTESKSIETSEIYSSRRTRSSARSSTVKKYKKSTEEEQQRRPHSTQEEVEQEDEVETFTRTIELRLGNIFDCTDYVTADSIACDVNIPDTKLREFTNFIFKIKQGCLFAGYTALLFPSQVVSNTPVAPLRTGCFCGGCIIPTTTTTLLSVPKTNEITKLVEIEKDAELRLQRFTPETGVATSWSSSFFFKYYKKV